MYRLVFFFLLSLFSCSENAKIIEEEYSFLGSGVGIETISQREDSLFFLKCFVGGSCITRPEELYKILSTQREKEIILVKLERIDSMPMRPDPIPETRYSVVIFKPEGKVLGFIHASKGLTKAQLETVNLEALKAKKKFFYSYFSQSYLKELAKLKPIATRENAGEILQAMKDPRFTEKVKAYAESDNYDMYNAGFSVDLLTSACIFKGYNPIGAGEKITTMSR